LLGRVDSVPILLAILGDSDQSAEFGIERVALGVQTFGNPLQVEKTHHVLDFRQSKGVLGGHNYLSVARITVLVLGVQQVIHTPMIGGRGEKSR